MNELNRLANLYANGGQRNIADFECPNCGHRYANHIANSCGNGCDVAILSYTTADDGFPQEHLNHCPCRLNGREALAAYDEGLRWDALRGVVAKRPQ